MKTFDWNLIPSFLAALDHGSLAAASRDTGISQPTLGRHIDDLEKALGVILFQRGRAGMLPTVAGLELADLARDMRRASAAISLAATGASESVSGTVRITASNIVSSYILPPIFADLLRDLPEIENPPAASPTNIPTGADHVL